MKSATVTFIRIMHDTHRFILFFTFLTRLSPRLRCRFTDEPSAPHSRQDRSCSHHRQHRRRCTGEHSSHVPTCVSRSCLPPCHITSPNAACADLIVREDLNRDQKRAGFSREIPRSCGFHRAYCVCVCPTFPRLVLSTSFD